MGKRKGKGKSAKNAKANQQGDNEEERLAKAPHSFVFQRGHVGKNLKELVLDVRKIMEPYTASKLKVRKKNVMKDLLTMAGPMHVSHFIKFTKTDVASYLRLGCVPRGPTLTFKICQYALARDVLSFQKHPEVEPRLFTSHAVMVTNIPQDSMENKLMNVTFKNMFPSINPNTVQLNNMRRCVLVNYNTETQEVEIRHYTMKVVPTGVSRAVKKLMRPRLPDMSQHTDIADVFLDKGLSDSEGEQDGPQSQVTVSQKVKDRGVARNATNAIRLKEIGPRLNLKLLKIEEGFEAGNVLYHAHITKTPEELEAMKKMKEQKKKEKLARKQRQEANVKKKKEAKEEQIKKTLEGMKKKKDQEKEKNESEENIENTEAPKEISESDDDDYTYYKKEVGQEPEPELFSKPKKRKRDERNNDFQTKKPKLENNRQGKSPTKNLKNGKKSKFSVNFSQPFKGKGKTDKGNQKKNPRQNKVKKPMFKPKGKKKK